VAALIAAQRDEHQIPHAVACRALGVSRSWFYKWRGGLLPPRAARRQLLTAEVQRLFALHQGKYGSPRITADLRDAGWRVSENTVAALMAEQHLAARQKRKRRSATRPGRGRWRAPDLVRRDFPAVQVNRKWYGDGTEIATDEGKLHLRPGSYIAASKEAEQGKISPIRVSTLPGEPRELHQLCMGLQQSRRVGGCAMRIRDAYVAASPYVHDCADRPKEMAQAGLAPGAA